MRSVPPAAVLFDLDGCLVDSEVLSLTSLCRTIAEAGRPDMSPVVVRDRFLGMSLAEIRAIVEREAGQALPDDFAERFHDRLYAA